MHMAYEQGTRLKDARNRQIFPYTKVECVEGLEDTISTIRYEIERLNSIVSGGEIPTPPEASDSSGSDVNTQSGFTYVIVDVLPDISDAEEGIVYSVKISDGTGSNKYKEYYYVPESEGVSAHYEQIGGDCTGGIQWLE